MGKFYSAKEKGVQPLESSARELGEPEYSIRSSSLLSGDRLCSPESSLELALCDICGFRSRATKLTRLTFAVQLANN
jgi:hypothetical protein